MKVEVQGLPLPLVLLGTSPMSNKTADDVLLLSRNIYPLVFAGKLEQLQDVLRRRLFYISRRLEAMLGYTGQWLPRCLHFPRPALWWRVVYLPTTCRAVVVVVVRGRPVPSSPSPAEAEVEAAARETDNVEPKM